MVKAAAGSRIGWCVAFCFIATGVTLRAPAHADAPAGYQTSWLGNTFGGLHDKWVQNNIASLFVAPDGTCYTDSYWDEAGHEAGIYKDGDVVGGCFDAHGHGGFAVTADGHCVYIACKLKDDTCGVRRYDLTGTPAPFPGGMHDGSFLSITPSASAIRGLAAWGDELYVSDYDANLIRVYNTRTMTPTRRWSIDRPTRLAAEAEGNLWIIQAREGTTPAQIVRCSPTGRLRKQVITDVVNPVALAIDPAGRLLVADDGPDQQVRLYDQISREPRLVGTLGEKGGIFAGVRGRTGAERFNGLTGVGVDAAGNVYVSHNGLGPHFADHPGFGAELKCFMPQGSAWKLRWHLQGLEFVDMAEPDPGCDTDVFTKSQHFVMDYTQPAGKQWTCVGQTLDRFAYPEDPRLHAASECVLGVRRIQGKRFLYLTSMYASFVSIYRWDDGNERFIPSGLIAREPFKAGNGGWPPYQPSRGDWIWRDANGDGRFDADEYQRHTGDNPYVWGWQVDRDGTLWKAMREDGIRRFPMQGLDAHGNPIYTYATSEVIPNPAPFDATSAYRGDINRIEYDAATDTMYLSGYTLTRPNKPLEWGQVGPVICRYGNWSKGNRTAQWELHPPYVADPNAAVLDKAMNVAGDYLFITYMKQPQVLVFDAHTGGPVTTLTPGPEVGGPHVGWVDVPYGVKAFKRSNGEYLIFNEEDWRGKVLMYRWTPGK